MSAGIFVGGEAAQQFEQDVCNYTGAEHCISLNSGTDALVCSMIALGVRPGDEVITPPNSFCCLNSIDCSHTGGSSVCRRVA